jgi:hypothetical protein
MNKKRLKFLIFFLLMGCSKAYYPPNTTYLSDSKFMDVSYIENIHILEFLQYLEADTTTVVWAEIDNGLFEKIKPKTAMGINGELNLAYMYDYLHRFVPVPMTIELANEYCKWRSAVVTCEKNFGQKNIPKNYSDLIKKNEGATTIIKFMIPTKLDLHIANESRTKFKRYNPVLIQYQALTKGIEDNERLWFLRCVAVVLVKKVE